MNEILFFLSVALECRCRETWARVRSQTARTMRGFEEWKKILENCGAQQHGARSTLRVDSSRYTIYTRLEREIKKNSFMKKYPHTRLGLWTQWNKSQPPSRRGKFFSVCWCKRYWIIVCIGVQEIVDHQREILPLLHTRPSTIVGDVSSLSMNFSTVISRDSLVVVWFE